MVVRDHSSIPDLKPDYVSPMVTPHTRGSSTHHRTSSGRTGYGGGSVVSIPEGINRQAMNDTMSVISQLEQQTVQGATPEDEKIQEVETLFYQGAGIGVAMYIILLLFTYWVAPEDSYEEPSGIEKMFHIVGGTLLIVNNGARLFPLLLRGKRSKFFKSGFVIGSFSVQAIALVANYQMAFHATPVVFDRVSGLRVHLIRWAEWIPLAFLMSFLTYNIDAPFRGSKVKVDLVFPTMMALSTSAGMIFPFCTDATTWWTVMFFSWALFMALYVVTYYRACDYLELKGSIERGEYKSKATAMQAEKLDLTKASFSLCLSCSVSWTILATLFTVLCLITNMAKEGSWIRHPAVPTILTCVFEVFSKVWYLSALFEAYTKVFDEKSRDLRRLEELRGFMSAVWASCSDVIVFCSKQGDIVNARISPSFLKMLGESTVEELGYDFEADVSLLVEIDIRKDEFSVATIDMDKPLSSGSTTHDNIMGETVYYRISSGERVNLPEVNLARIAKLAHEACTLAPSVLETLSPAKFVTKPKKGVAQEVECELSIAMLEGRSCVLALRDISERMEKFQVEKKLVREVTSRKKDEEANRFTRHEVKNALLAAISILDHLKVIMVKGGMLPTPKGGLNDSSSVDSPVIMMDMDVDENPEMKETIESVSELDSTIRDVLDTILDEAMAREIIYGEYDPKAERLMVPAVLDSFRRRSSFRFPLEIIPDGPSFPLLEMDRQLLRYIYRNAVSNAVKYGKKKGTVETKVTYEHHNLTFTLNVTNMPGVGHDKLCQLSAREVSKVFEQHSQLEATQAPDFDIGAQKTKTQSSGNGAWIMRKCAEAMGGQVGIKFEQKRTVFSFTLQVSPTAAPARRASLAATSAGPSNQMGSIREEQFRLPPGTVGVVLDDSRSQRKVLRIFLKLIGIEPDKQVILGETHDEIYKFDSIVRNLLRDHPSSKILMIIDENLDVVEGGTTQHTVSGSLTCKKILSELADEDERRLLCLIRSANDSFMDVAVYKARAHGYLRKEPLQKEGNLDLIQPWWEGRFKADEPSAPFDDETSLGFGLEDDIRDSLGVIAALAGNANNARWKPIRDKLHALKGDLMVTVPPVKLAPAQKKLEKLQNEETLPRDFENVWSELQEQIEAMLATIPEPKTTSSRPTTEIQYPAAEQGIAPKFDRIDRSGRSSSTPLTAHSKSPSASSSIISAAGRSRSPSSHITAARDVKKQTEQGSASKRRRWWSKLNRQEE